MAEPDLGIIRYSVKSVDFEGTIDFTIYIDGDVKMKTQIMARNSGRK
jgi:hypothetical protein